MERRWLFNFSILGVRVATTSSASVSQVGQKMKVGGIVRTDGPLKNLDKVCCSLNFSRMDGRQGMSDGSSELRSQTRAYGSIWKEKQHFGIFRTTHSERSS